MSDSNDNDDKSAFKGGDNFFSQMLDAGIADEKFIREIVEMFLVEGEQSLNNLEKAFEHKDHQNIKLFAHKLKSSFLMFDLHDAHSLALKLEEVNGENVLSYDKTVIELKKTCAQNFDLLRKKYLF